MESQLESASEILVTDKRRRSSEDTAAPATTPALPQEPTRRAVKTAFAVVVELDGTVQATGDVSILDGVAAQRGANLNDMFGACAHVQKDISNAETVMRLMQGLSQQAQAAMDQAQAQQQMRGLDLRGR